MVKGLKTGTNLSTKFFFPPSGINALSNAFLWLKDRIINSFPMTLVGQTSSTKENSKYCQYADSERSLFPLTFCSEQKVAY